METINVENVKKKKLNISRYTITYYGNVMKIKQIELLVTLPKRLHTHTLTHNIYIFLMYI